MILLVTNLPGDLTVTRLQAVLDSRGVESMVLSPESMAEHNVSLRIKGGGQATLCFDDRSVDLRDIRSAWLWRIWYGDRDDPRLEQVAADRDDRAFFQREWIAFHKGLTTALQYSNVFCLNPPPFNVAFEEKCCQMLLASQVGLCVPDTLYTARLGGVREFYDEHHEQIIYKPFKGHAIVRGHDEAHVRVALIYTNRVAGERLVEGPDFIPTPCIFQPYIPKAIELRIVIIDRSIFACAIHSQQSERSRDDWRRYDLEHTPYTPYDLPEHIQQRLFALMDRLGLIYGSVDMILTPEGEYVFLEINPNGQFDWVAQRAALPIYEHLAELLTHGPSVGRRGDTAEVPYAV